MAAVESKIVKIIGDRNLPFLQTIAGMMLVSDPSISPAEGTTTALGNVGGTTLIDNLRTEATNHWNGQLILITSGINAGQVREIVTWNLPAFTFTVTPALEAQVAIGVTYKVLSALAAGAVIAALQADVGDASASTLTSIYAILGNPAQSLTAMLSHIVSSLDFWSVVVEELQLTSAAQANLALNANITVAGIPAGATINRVVVMFMCRSIENTHATIANKLQGAQNIQVNFAGGAFLSAIALADDLFAVGIATREMGTVLVGSIDVKATVTGNGNLTFQIDSARADQNNLNFNDYQVGVRVFFTV